MTGEGPQPCGTFEVDANGVATVAAETYLAEVAVVAVTVEPDGGSEEPTTTRILARAVQPRDA